MPNETTTTNPTASAGPLAALIGAALCLLLATAALNYRVDPAALFDDGAEAQRVATVLTNENAIALTHVDDRQLHAAVAQRMRTAPDTLVLGSSRGMTISAKMVPGTLYNAGAGSATLPDVMALTEAFIEADRIPRRILLSVDTWLLTDPPINQRWRTVADLYNSMLRRLGETPTMPTSGFWSRAEALISLSYTLESLAKVQADPQAALFGAATAATTVDPAAWNGPMKRADGSLRYGRDFSERAPALIEAAALIDAQQITAEALASGAPDPDMTDRLDRYADFLQSDGVELVLLLAPFNPLTWRAVAKGSRPDYLKDRERFIRQWATRNDVRVIGSYDPQRAHCTQQEFYDGVHARPPCLARLLTSLKAAGART